MSDTGRPLSAVVLAAGEGTRMRSARPKPLHLLCGRPMVLHVLDALAELSIDRAVVVVGHGAEQVTKTVHELAPPGMTVDFVEQHVQRGTGDAVSVALTGFPDDDEHDGDLVVLPGDTPLLRPPTLAALVRLHRQSDAAATLLTAEVDDPYGYGRIVRGKDDRVARVVEEADATDDERAIHEVNTSIYCFRRSVLAPALRRLSPENAQGEYYLTDVVAVLHDAGYPVVSLIADDPTETAGVNDRAQLAAAEAELRDRTNERWMRRGVNMLDPERTYVDASVELAPDVTIFPGTILQGRTVVGRGAEIGPDTRLVDCTIGEDAVVEGSVGHQAEVGEGAVVGPFAVLQPGAHVAAGARTGSFVEVTEDGSD
ncbi:MAG TPA: bifunctional UDP-N-acetylglucosamine diphosphorylase/glucosamine-1-phosphate N-acetyltransferase GlmU [Acidimicrobiales bacterium]|nr:bifunctional UDP-N-acetylglucosamine diphosphorylase/glucosamine-1-phosphate N-acetyltransferase GlmU [Acidimicrobiales bacterium]